MGFQLSEACGPVARRFTTSFVVKNVRFEGSSPGLYPIPFMRNVYALFLSFGPSHRLLSRGDGQNKEANIQ